MTENPTRSESGVHWQSARVVEVIPRTGRIKSFFLELTKPFAHRAGQHIDLRLTAPDGYQAMRSYSIASAPDSANRIEIAIELLDNGEVSPFFHEIVAVGDEIELRGPLGGHFIWTGSDGGPLLLMGGGSGVVPLMSMIRQRQATAAHVPAILLLSARRLNEVLYRDELVESGAPRKRLRACTDYHTGGAAARGRLRPSRRRADGGRGSGPFAHVAETRLHLRVERVRQRRSRRSHLRRSAGTHY